MDIIPAIIPRSEEHLRSSIALLADHASAFQIDFVDGKYDDDISWPWKEEASFDVAAVLLTELAVSKQLEADLMVEEPALYIEACVKAGVGRIAVHVGSTEDLASIFKAHKKTAIGLAFTNDTPLDALHEYKDKVAFVQCMGIKEIGSQGQGFDERVLPRIREIKAAYPDLEVSIDGHVTMFTLPLLKAAGATRFVAGSAIFDAPDPVRAYQELTALANA